MFYGFRAGQEEILKERYWMMASVADQKPEEVITSFGFSVWISKKYRTARIGTKLKL
jgi:hypothetical protein